MPSLFGENKPFLMNGARGMNGKILWKTRS